MPAEILPRVPPADIGLSAGGLLGVDAHKGLQDVLVRAKPHPLADIINSLIVRSMKQAVYSPESAGHFGIATRAYAHFTSPIRRYPDLMAHRAVVALLAGKKENHGALPLTAAGAHCSERERAAAEAEHKSVDILRAELLKAEIGTIMDGTVTSVIDSGTFVMIGDTGAEGMLRVGNLKPGDKIKVKLDAVDTIEGKIDLSLAGPAGTPRTGTVRTGPQQAGTRQAGAREGSRSGPSGRQMEKAKNNWRITPRKKRRR